jgi:hypothetical protein
MWRSPEVATWYLRDSTWKSLSAYYDKASWMQMTLHWIPIIWSFLRANPSPSRTHLPLTSGSTVSKLWVVLSNSKWRACYQTAMIVSGFCALWGNSIVLRKHDVLWLVAFFGIIGLAMNSNKCKLIFTYRCNVGTFRQTVFVHTLRNIARRPPTYPKLQAAESYVTNFSCLACWYKNSVLQSEIRYP